MNSPFHTLLCQLEAFERWFDKHFGWFFTNGMKEYRAHQGSDLKA